MPEIILATINARYIHASLGLRYLLANMAELEARTTIAEFTIDQRPIDIVERLLESRPRIVGLGVYIWNIQPTTEVVGLLKRIAPQTVIIVGGPEVSYETDNERIALLADHVIAGPADRSFAQTCRTLLSGGTPPHTLCPPRPPELSALRLPYRHYTDSDLAHRFTYVEASRGCPFKCEFCLSSLDKTAWPFDLPDLLAELELLHRRGARSFKFVDRTFNLKAATCVAILEFFLARMDEQLFVHFEVIPDRLPQALKAPLVRFAPGSLQFEVGIQTLNPRVQSLISRRQNNAQAKENLHWLREHTSAHIHVDLIFGLPGEDLESFGRGFDELTALAPHEIQVGILKRLKGTPIDRHRDEFAMTYNPDPPYNVLKTDRVDFATMQAMNRFARYWDMIANSGRFRHALPLLLGEAPFARFFSFSDWLWQHTQQTHRIALHRLFDHVQQGLTDCLGESTERADTALTRDRRLSETRTRAARRVASDAPKVARRRRQQQHLRS